MKKKRENSYTYKSKNIVIYERTNTTRHVQNQARHLYSSIHHMKIRSHIPYTFRRPTRLLMSAHVIVLSLHTQPQLAYRAR